MVGGGFDEVVFWRLGHDAGDVVIDEKEGEKHETGKHGAEDRLGVNALKGIGRPVSGREQRGLPIPRCGSNVDPFQFVATVVERRPRQVTQRRHDDQGDHHIVTRHEISNRLVKVWPRLGKVQRPADVKGRNANHNVGIRRRTLVRRHVRFRPADGRDEISNALKTKRDADEEFEDLRRKGSDPPDEVDQADHGRDAMHQGGPHEDPPKEGKVFGVKLLRQSVTRPQQQRRRPGNAQHRQRLAGKDGVDDADDAGAQQNFRNGQVTVGLPVQDFGKDQRRNQLHDKGVKGSVEDANEILGAAPVVGQ
mmetsp:Transcript_30074/g.46207  ORF Transcript_30074/g.46207 Transcript_30074/m.46207 type:complete len:307 (+) Transcript_30074:467-1387(+)